MQSMKILARVRRLAGVAISSGLGVTLLSAAASAQAVNFHFHFGGTMSCHSPIPVANAPVSGDGAGTLNPDGSVSAEITQSLLVFATTLHFDSRLGSGLTPVPGGTGQVRVTGRQGLKFIWNLPNNSLVVNVNVRGKSCSANFAANLHPGKTEVSMFDGSMYHYCSPPVMTSSMCEIR